MFVSFCQNWVRLTFWSFGGCQKIQNLCERIRWKLRREKSNTGFYHRTEKCTDDRAVEWMTMMNEWMNHLGWIHKKALVSRQQPTSAINQPFDLQDCDTYVIPAALDTPPLRKLGWVRRNNNAPPPLPFFWKWIPTKPSQTTLAMRTTAMLYMTLIISIITCIP